jgi:hypothetical protein
MWTRKYEWIIAMAVVLAGWMGFFALMMSKK